MVDNLGADCTRTGTLIYSAQSKATKIAKDGAAHAPVQTYPTAANLHTYGCWHICGNCGP